LYNNAVRYKFGVSSTKVRGSDVGEDGFESRVSKVGALTDPIRRALYHFVAYQPGSVSRDQAAAGVDVPRHTAKFHLDKLVDEGLLVTEFKRLTGRTGPGAGRPAKLYRRARQEVNVTLPRRRYDLAGHVLADAASRSLGGMPMDEALRAAAVNAADVVLEAWPPAAADGGTQLHEILTKLGYEPRANVDALTLRNCPFRQLSDDHEDLICTLNRDFISALAQRLGCNDRQAETVTRGTGCCVRVTPIPPDE
jgi:predicted ArsR family transcriptional regulator